MSQQSIWYRFGHFIGSAIHHDFVNLKATLETEVHSIMQSVSSFFSNNPLVQLNKHYASGTFTLEPSSSTLAHSAGKVPAILVPGTWTNAGSMSDIYQSLDKAGIPAYATTFGRDPNSLVGLLPFAGGVAPIAESEKQLASFIGQVEKETGASKVDLIGHSQGGLLIKDYIAHDTKNDVQAVVDLGATNHGTNFLSPPIRLWPFTDIGSAILGQGATDQSYNSEFIHDLNQTPDTKAGIHYLVLGTKNDLISVPYKKTFLKAIPGADVTNLEVHSIPGVHGYVGHLDLPFNPGIINVVTRYIETKGEPDQTRKFASTDKIPVDASQIGGTAANPYTNSAKDTSPKVSLLN